ncbi:MAG: LLM class flavin-dependent oxidoreductase [Chloroflexota bacterium]|nr:LLM class flavin-dependent oxidoreductase [Chloroflexota bacterium]
MDIGIALPQMGPYASPATIVQIAQEAERLDYASVWVGERLLRPRHYVPYGYPPIPMPDYFKTMYDPLETLSYVAAKTERIKLGTSVINAFFHVPVVLARRFATLDQFSQGRVIAGLGQGWLKDEFETANISFQRRGNGLADYMGALRAAWGPDPVHYEGRFYRIVESDIGPKPFQPDGGPPVLFGAVSKVALERAARLANGLNPIARTWSSLEQIARIFPEMVRQAGRDPQQMLIVVRSNNAVGEPHLSEASGPRTPLSGSLPQIRDDVQRLESLGIGHIFFDLLDMPIHEQLRLLEKLRRVADR